MHSGHGISSPLRAGSGPDSSFFPCFTGTERAILDGRPCVACPRFLQHRLIALPSHDRLMPNIRFRLRTVLIIIAIVGIALGWIARVPRRRDRFNRWSSEYRLRAASDLLGAMPPLPSTPYRPADPRKFDREQAELLKKSARHNLKLSQKYQWAADHAWLPVLSEWTE